MNKMRQVLLTLFLIAVLLPLGAQNQYISNSRCTTEDRFEDLGGDGGVILLSRHKDLVIALPNVKINQSVLTGNALTVIMNFVSL